MSERTYRPPSLSAFGFSPGFSALQQMPGFSRVTVVPGSWAYNKGSYSLFVVDAFTSKIYDITDYLNDLTYQFDDSHAYATMNIKLVNMGSIQSVILKSGNWVILYGPYFSLTDPLGFISLPGIRSGDNQSPYPSIDSGIYTEIDRAVITTVTGTIGDDKSITLICKDPGYLLEKNKIPYRLPQGTLDERLKFIEGRGILDLRSPLLQTKTVLDPTRGGVDTVWKDIQYDLGETNTSEGTRYVIRRRKEQWYLQEITDQPRMWSFEVGNNVFNMQVAASIDNYYNIIYVISTASNQITTINNDVLNDPTDLKLDVTGYAANVSDIPYLGQHIYISRRELEAVALADDQAQAAYLLKKYNRISTTATIQSYAIWGIRVGDQVLLYVPEIEATGIYYVRSAKYHLANGDCTMELTVDFYTVVPDQVRKQIVKSNDALAHAFSSASGANGIPFGASNVPSDSNVPVGQ